MKESKIKQRVFELADLIDQKREKLTGILLDYESYETVNDEFFHSTDCLRNIDIEIGNLSKGKVQSICTFFPLNLPLYSLMIFAVIPSFVSERVFIRQPERMGEILKSIYRILEIEKNFPGVTIVDVERGMFLDGYASVADVVIFTGRYENAKIVEEASPNALFLYNGAGINPIVVSKSADLELAVKKTIEMRVFNSGQDCAGPDAILVDHTKYQEFLEILTKELMEVRVGDYHDRTSRVGKLGDYRQIPIISQYFDNFRESIISGGIINFKDHIVFPTIVATEPRPGLGYQEFFAPIFHAMPYKNEKDLDRYFNNQHYQDHAMYIMLFGDLGYIENIKHSIIIKNKIVNDVERGNFAYGGYGRKANFIGYNSRHVYRPVLISREIAYYLRSWPGETLCA